MVNGIHNHSNFDLSILRGGGKSGGAQAESTGIQPIRPQRLQAPGVPNPGDGNAINDHINPANADQSKINTGFGEENPQGNNLQEN